MYSLSVPDVLSAISNDKSLVLFNTVALEAGNTDILKTRLALTRKQYYSRMSDLIDAGLIIRKNGKYFLTSFGKVVYEAQMIIGKGIQNYWKLKAIDSIESPPNGPRLPAEEYNRFIDTLVDCSDIKDILLRNNNITTTQKEKVYNKQEVIVSVSAKPSSI
jgi:predicted transcriptional regulator